MKLHEIEAMIRDLERIEQSIPHDMMRDATKEARAFLKVRDMIRRICVTLTNIIHASRDVRVSRVDL